MSHHSHTVSLGKTAAAYDLTLCVTASCSGAFVRVCTSARASHNCSLVKWLLHHPRGWLLIEAQLDGPTSVLPDGSSCNRLVSSALSPVSCRDGADPATQAGLRLLSKQWHRLVSAAMSALAPSRLDTVAQLCMFSELDALDLSRAAAQVEGL